MTLTEYSLSKKNDWSVADRMISINMRKYCLDDATIAMKMTKNRMYGSVATKPNISHVTGPHTVDGTPWWQVDLVYDAAEWLRDLRHSDVKEVEGCENCFDMPEDIYILTKLKWA